MISARLILSAAHCFDGTQPRDVKVVINANHIYNDGISMTVDRIVKHKDFNRNNQMENELVIEMSLSSCLF